MSLLLAAGAAGATVSNASPGTYVITGFAATSTQTRASNANPGTYALTGFATTDRRTYVSVASPGNYVITGFDATSTYSAAAPVQVQPTGRTGGGFVTRIVQDLPPD